MRSTATSLRALSGQRPQPWSATPSTRQWRFLSFGESFRACSSWPGPPARWACALTLVSGLFASDRDCPMAAESRLSAVLEERCSSACCWHCRGRFSARQQSCPHGALRRHGGERQRTLGAGSGCSSSLRGDHSHTIGLQMPDRTWGQVRCARRAGGQLPCLSARAYCYQCANVYRAAESGQSVEKLFRRAE